MKYIVETRKTIEQVCSGLESSVTKYGFGVLHIHDLKQTLNGKGIQFPNSCKVFEVCNPQKANDVMTYDMSLNMALPCRISVWEEKGKIYIGMISPKSILSLLSQSPQLMSMAKEVEETLEKIISEVI